MKRWLKLGNRDQAGQEKRGKDEGWRRHAGRVKAGGPILQGTPGDRKGVTTLKEITENKRVTDCSANVCTIEKVTEKQADS